MTTFANALETCKYQGKLYQVPMDSMSIQMLVNTGHAKEAGLDPAKLPATGEELVEWAKAMTQREGDTVTRSLTVQDRNTPGGSSRVRAA